MSPPHRRLSLRRWSGAVPLRSNAPAAATRSRAGKLYVLTGAVLFVALSLVLTAWRSPSAPAAGHGALGLLVPPSPLHFDRADEWVSIAWAASSLPTAVSLAVRDSLRSRSFLPIALVLSTPLIAFPATLVDALGGAYMLDGPHLTVLRVFGRDMGIFIFAAWSGFGIFVYLAYTVLTRGSRTAVLWWLLAAGCAGDILSEECLLPRGAYVYFGNQPLVLIHLLPWWWVPCSIVGCFLAAAIAHRYRSALRRWRILAVALTTPLSVLAVYTVAAPPALVAVNNAYSWLPNQALGLATVALALAVFSVTVRHLAHRVPRVPDAVPRETGRLRVRHRGDDSPVRIRPTGRS